MIQTASHSHILRSVIALSVKRKLMPWTNWGEQINREEMLGFVKQKRNRCDVILQFKPQDYLLYTLLEDIYEDA